MLNNLNWFLLGVLFSFAIFFCVGCGNVEVNPGVNGEQTLKIVTLVNVFSEQLLRVAEIQRQHLEVTKKMKDRISTLEMQLQLVTRSAILRKTASGTSFVTFDAHCNSDDEFFDERKASSTAEILTDERGIKSNEEKRRMKAEKEK